MKKTNTLTLGILITTCNENIKKVKKNLLPKLIKNKGVDEIIISHQIFDEKTKPEKNLTKGKVKYLFLKNKGVSKNRNNCLKYSTSDICHICDDDVIYLKDFEKKIKEEYKKNENFDLITFQAINQYNVKRYKVKEGRHNIIIPLRLSACGMSFRRKPIIKKNIIFDENFGLGAKYCCGEENIFLKECVDKKLNLRHSNKIIVLHKDLKEKNKLILYKDLLIISRIQVFKKIYGFLGGVFAVFYFSIFKYREYKNKYSFFKYFWISLKEVWR